MYVPLAHQLRPKSFDDIVGQSHLIGPNAPFRKLVEADVYPSIILYGPPGTGKTTIAETISVITNRAFIKLNATNASIKDVRAIGEKSTTVNSVVFVDEIHRFSRVQQDALLPYAECGSIIFIGATTENPFHTINAPLVSRCQIFELKPLTNAEVGKILVRGIKALKVNKPGLTITSDAMMRVIVVANRDGRKAISILEVLAAITDVITLEIVEATCPNKYFTLSDDNHFDYASAYQGSIQASDADSAIYWLARWLESGEDPRYIGRRLLVSAAEDAAGNPICTAVAHAAYVSACEIGRPECDIVLAQATIMIAQSPRNKSAANAIWAAVKDVKSKTDLEVPKEMKDSHYKAASKLGNGSYHDGKNQLAYVGVNKVYVRQS